jgi:hypothetical protein
MDVTVVSHTSGSDPACSHRDGTNVKGSGTMRGVGRAFLAGDGTDLSRQRPRIAENWDIRRLRSCPFPSLARPPCRRQAAPPTPRDRQRRIGGGYSQQNVKGCAEAASPTGAPLPRRTAHVLCSVEVAAH